MRADTGRPLPLFDLDHLGDRVESDSRPRLVLVLVLVLVNPIIGRGHRRACRGGAGRRGWGATLASRDLHIM